MTVMARPEILTSLNSIREDVQQKIGRLDRYRALKAIERTIADFPMLQEVAQPLADIRDRVQQQLAETTEYRALRTLERIVPELSEVLAMLGAGTDSPQAEPAEPVRQVPSKIAEAVPASEEVTTPVTVVLALADERVDAADNRQAALFSSEPQLEPSMAAADAVDPGDALPPANDAGQPDESPMPAPPRPSYGIAQFLNTEEPPERSPTPEMRVDDGAAPLRVASPQEDRAA